MTAPAQSLLIESRSLGASYGAHDVLSDVTFGLRAGEVFGLIGPNGAGKTTLLRLLAGVLEPRAGSILFLEQPLDAYDPMHLAQKIAYLPQAGEVHWDVAVETLVMMGRLPHLGRWRRPGAADHKAVSRAMAACDLDALRGRSVRTLSGGERGRALLARALAVEPKLLLADEPVAGLDPAHQLDVMVRLRRLAGEGASVVVVMHDLTHAARFCDRLAILYDATIAAIGPPDEVLTPALLARCFGVRAFHGRADDGAIVLPLERTNPAGLSDDKPL